MLPRATNLFLMRNLKADEASLHSMAKKMQELMQHAAIPNGQTGVNDTIEEGGIEAECSAWLAGLATFPSGQKLMDHLTHLEAAPHMRSSSAFEQALSFRRVFMHALSKNPAPFGLPKKFPKYIVVANLSGEKLLLYSSNPNLVTLLTLSHSNSSSSFEGC